VTVEQEPPLISFSILIKVLQVPSLSGSKAELILEEFLMEFFSLTALYPLLSASLSSESSGTAPPPSSSKREDAARTSHAV